MLKRPRSLRHVDGDVGFAWTLAADLSIERFMELKVIHIGRPLDTGQLSYLRKNRGVVDPRI